MKWLSACWKTLFSDSISSPLTFFELRKQSVSERSFFWRMFLPLALLVLFWIIFNDAEAASREELSNLTIRFVGFYFLLQIALLLYFCPISIFLELRDEKNACTLDLLKISELTPLEIVLGKIHGAMIPSLMLLLSGCPALALMLHYGGVPFFLMLYLSVVNILLLAILSVNAALLAFDPKTRHCSVGQFIIHTLFSLLPIAFQFAVWTWNFSFINDLIMMNVWLFLVLVPVLIGVYFGRLKELAKTVQKFQITPEPIPIAPNATESEMDSLIKLSSLLQQQGKPETQSNSSLVRSRIVAPMGNHPILWKELNFPSYYKEYLPYFYVFQFFLVIVIGFIVMANADMNYKSDPWNSFSLSLRHRGNVAMSYLLSLIFLSFIGFCVLHLSLSFQRDRKTNTLIDLLLLPVPRLQLLFCKWYGSFRRYWVFTLPVGLALAVNLLLATTGTLLFIFWIVTLFSALTSFALLLSLIGGKAELVRYTLMILIFAWLAGVMWIPSLGNRLPLHIQSSSNLFIECLLTICFHPLDTAIFLMRSYLGLIDWMQMSTFSDVYLYAVTLVCLIQFLITCLCFYLSTHYLISSGDAGSFQK